jgi:hypothetical protein
MASKRRERAAVTSIREAGGWAWYDWEYSRSPDLAKPPGPAWLRFFVGDDFFANVEVLLITNGCAEDVVLRALDELNDVQRIELSCGEVTEAMVRRLKRMKKLKLLAMSSTAIAPARLAEVVKALPGCNVFKSFEAVAELPSLLAALDAERDGKPGFAPTPPPVKTCHCRSTRTSRHVAGVGHAFMPASRGEMRPTIPPCCTPCPDALSPRTGGPVRLTRRAPGPCCCTAL